jgi:hypothetical protein
MVEESCIQKIHLTDRLFLECILRASAVCVEILRVIVLSNRSAYVGVRTVVLDAYYCTAACVATTDFRESI